MACAQRDVESASTSTFSPIWRKYSASVTAVYTDASREATGMDDVLHMMMVRFISDWPVFGSMISGNSLSVSTTSPARSPQAAEITISTFA